VEVVTQRFVTIGRIKRSFGVKGEVLVRLRAKTSLLDLIGVQVWATPPSLGWRSGKVLSAEPHSDEMRMSFEGLDSIELSKPLAGSALIVSADDIYGDLGSVRETIVTGANDVWVIDGRYGEVLIPVIDTVVRSVDDEFQRIVTKALPGLIEGEPL